MLRETVQDYLFCEYRFDRHADVRTDSQKPVAWGLFLRDGRKYRYAYQSMMPERVKLLLVILPFILDVRSKISIPEFTSSLSRSSPYFSRNIFPKSQ